ncbi:MAG: hypothetical protein M1829_000436 [Trizodia sp. TS-e1964]|nr:MAG: hypothetical protein M1829_000436 [Trizodia sp. TS-e1964]
MLTVHDRHSKLSSPSRPPPPITRHESVTPATVEETVLPDAVQLSNAIPSPSAAPNGGARIPSSLLPNSEINGSEGPMLETVPQPPPKDAKNLPPALAPAASNPGLSINKSLNPSAPQTPRRGSWLSTLSSKFSSLPDSPRRSASQLSLDDLRERVANGEFSEQAHGPKVDAPYVPQPPKADHPSFFQSAFRRLSSSGSQLPGARAARNSGRIVERRVMNKNPNRERCQIQELDISKLRRVAFSVDIEIAAPPRYDNGAEENKPAQSRIKSKESIKDKQLNGAGEVEALKSDAPKDSKNKDSPPSLEGERLDSENGAPPNRENLRKKEKKKRSEEERKERREKKRIEAEENGTKPVETPMNAPFSINTSHPPSSQVGQPPTPKAQRGPTTDPLRIYRRCCQLRETPILKRIADQLETQSQIRVNSPGVVSCLDLSGYRMQLPDIVTLGDYLAVVPVKQLKLENCGLSDEALRVILAGLLATKSQSRDQPISTLSNGINTLEIPNNHIGKHGVVEKLVLKNNPKIGPDGWRYISIFVHMSKSIKAIDLSEITFPPPLGLTNGTSALVRTASGKAMPVDVSILFSKAIGERVAGSHLEELVMAECGLSTENISHITEACIKSGLKRLGISGNQLTKEGLEHVARYLRDGACEGLDLGGNNLEGLLHILAVVLDDSKPLYALSLADCNLDAVSLSELLPSLTKLSNFRFIDLSHNQKLFLTQPDALPLLRRYLPQLASMKRIHLADVSMSSDHAISLAEVLPECPSLAHLNIFENPQLTALASAKDEAGMEEACALYASLMAAVRVSNTIVCIDIDVPSADSSEIVKALARQVVAYSLRNMERGPVSAFLDSQSSEKKQITAVPDVLLHIVGQVDGFPEDHMADEPAPDTDYVIGGTGVVKALSVCLGNCSYDRRQEKLNSTNATTINSDDAASAISSTIEKVEIGGARAKDMSKNLLGSARNIRMRLQPALIKEAKQGDDDASYKRLLFLDITLERMIQRFEDEYPECRLLPQTKTPDDEATSRHSSEIASPQEVLNEANSPLKKHKSSEDLFSAEEISDEEIENAHLERHDSEISLASRALSNEEGRMHRFGQRVRSHILRPQSLDHAHGTTGQETEAEHLQVLRKRIEAINGEDILKAVDAKGTEALLAEIGASAVQLQRLMIEDPECFEKFKEVRELTQENVLLTAPSKDEGGEISDIATVDERGQGDRKEENEQNLKPPEVPPKNPS